MSLIVYIFSVFFPCRRNSSALRVRSAGHALNLNKGCTKRQSLPNCQQNGRPGREYRPGKQDARCYFVRNGAATKVRRADAFLRKDRPTEPAAERHGKQLPKTRRPGFRGYKSRDPDRTAAERGAAVPALSSALAYFDSYRTARGSANLLQAQRDCFGAHTYERIDKEGAFHTDWMN